MPSAQTDLIALIKDKQAQIAKLQAELDEARRVLLGPPAGTQKLPPLPPMPRRAPNKKLPFSSRQASESSSVSRTIEVLREHGGPMAVDEILARIHQKYGERVKKDTLVGNLSRYVKAGKTFHRPKPSMYGLLEQKEHTKAG